MHETEGLRASHRASQFELTLEFDTLTYAFCNLDVLYLPRFRKRTDCSARAIRRLATINKRQFRCDLRGEAPSLNVARSTRRNAAILWLSSFDASSSSFQATSIWRMYRIATF